MPAGWYGEFTITGDPMSLPNVELTYTHHIHSPNSISESVENNSSERESVTTDYPDDYQAETAGGCYTTPYYYIPAHEEVTPVYCYDYREYWSNYFQQWECPSCGHSPHSSPRFLRNQSTNVPAHWSSINENNRATKINYKLSCGHSSGEVTDVHIHY